MLDTEFQQPEFQKIVPHEQGGAVIVSTEFRVQNVLPWQINESGQNILPEADISTTLPPDFFHRDDKDAVYMTADSADFLNDGEYGLSVSGSDASLIVVTIKGNKYFTSTARRNDSNLFPDTLYSIERVSLPPNFGGYSFAEALASQLGGNDSPYDPGVKILESVGYEFEFEGESKLIPTPQTVEIIAEKHNLPIKVIADRNDYGILTNDDYLQSFSEGYYPVGTGNLAVYAHDVRSNDHMVGVVVLGHEGLEMLAPIATAAMTHEDKVKKDIASFFDYSTSMISSVLNEVTNQQYIEIYANEAVVLNIATAKIADHCRTAEYKAEFVGTKIDGQALFDLIKNRISSLHAELELGDVYDRFIEALQVQELPPARTIQERSEPLGFSIF